MSELGLYLLGFHFMDGSIRKAVVMEKAHLLVQQTVNNVSSSVLPLHQANKVPVQGCAQVHGPVITIQGHLRRQKGQK